MRVRLRQTIVSGLFAVLLTSSADAQSLSPMRAVVTSMADQFAVRVFPGNPYAKRVQITIKVFDQNFREIRAQVRPRVFFVEAGGRRPVTVVVPFEGRFSRKVRICAETTPYLEKQTRLRGQVCGRFLGRRVG